DRLARLEVAHARHAHEARLAVHLGTARTAAARFAVPAHREIRRLLRLHVVHGVEHHHAGVRLHLVPFEFAPFLVPPPNPPRCFLGSGHGYLSSSRIFLISSGTSGSGTSSTSMPLPPARHTMLTFAKCSLSMSGKSSRA